MDNTMKFDGVNYTDTFARRISVMHALVKSILPDIIKTGDHIIDMGGGPGIGARIIDELGIKAKVTNIEPSTTIYDVPRLSSVDYIPLKMSLKEALDAHMPCMADCLMMVSSAHEIALCNSRTPVENKRIFFEDVGMFIGKNLKRDGNLVIGFPNYRKGASEEEITRQRRLTESLLGHSHPPDEFFTVEEFSAAFGTRPVVSVQKPMDITHENSEDTALMANVAVFKL